MEGIILGKFTVPTIAIFKITLSYTSITFTSITQETNFNFGKSES